MTEQEIKDTVEQIVSLEQEADELAERGDFSGSSACTEVVQMLEIELEEYGYFLGEAAEDMIVYRKGQMRFARDTWLIFNRSNGRWRYSNEQEEL